MEQKPFKKKRLPSYKKVHTWLILILALKIFGFAAISEVPAIAQSVKVGLGLLCTGAIFLVQNYLDRRGLVVSIRYINLLAILFYILFLLEAFISLTWSSDFIFSLIQCFRYADFFVFSIVYVRVVVVWQKYYSEKAGLPFFLLWAIFLNGMFFLIGFIVDYDTFMRGTHGGEVKRLGGLIMNPNEVGLLAVTGMSVAYVEMGLGKSRFWHGLAIAIMAYILFLTSSRSSMISFALVTGIFVLRSGNKTLIIGMVLAVLLAGPFIVDKVFLKDGHVDAEEMMTMTGRLPFWKALMTEALPQEPLLGYGFMCIYYTKFFQGAETYPASMTHNTFIQVFVSLGFVGAFIVLMQMIFGARGALVTRRTTDSALFLAVIIPVFINSLTEFGMWGITNYGVLFYMLIFILPCTEYNSMLNRREETRKQVQLRTT